jgi:two-component system, cell cycle sensor histidine kinase and response regulator CckA
MLNDVALNPQKKTLQAKHMEHWQLVTSGVAHDFNNLLTSILGQSSLALLQLPEEAVARSHIEKVIKAAEYATALTDQLLTYSQGDNAKLEAINLNLLLQDNLSLLDTAFLDGITLDVQMAAHLPTFVGKRGQIQQVVMNLLINAAEAIHSSRGIITVRTGQQKRNGKKETGPIGGNGFYSSNTYIFLQIQDNGSGIDAATLNHIFEPYFTTKPNGRGLGLSAVKEIIQQYQGHLDIHSEVGKGTIVTIYFPVDKSLASPGSLFQ